MVGKREGQASKGHLGGQQVVGQAEDARRGQAPALDEELERLARVALLQQRGQHHLEQQQLERQLAQRAFPAETRFTRSRLVSQTAQRKSHVEEGAGAVQRGRVDVVGEHGGARAHHDLDRVVDDEQDGQAEHHQRGDEAAQVAVHRELDHLEATFQQREKAERARPPPGSG